MYILNEYFYFKCYYSSSCFFMLGGFILSLYIARFILLYYAWAQVDALEELPLIGNYLY